MSVYVIMIAALIIQGALHCFVSWHHRNQWVEYIAQKERLWEAERKDLLDRIQAPSFAEYTNKVIKEKKLDKQDDEKEERVEFIS
jgi:hypothetical protein